MRSAVIAILFLSIPAVVVAQTPPTPRTTRVPRNPPPDAPAPKSATPIPLNAPPWLKEFRFPQTKFTLVRIKYDSRRGLSWATDFPDADLNLVAQLGALTKLDVSQPSLALRLTDPAVAKHPVLYLGEPGLMSLKDDEVTALRKYLDAGGFLLMDDFWGDAEWENVRAELRRVFPDREPTDLPLTHPVFHCVFDLKEKPQVVSIHAYLSGAKTERKDALEAHYRALTDASGRVVVLICQNTDLGDGWERDGEDPGYTREMSVAKAFPMGINILFYALTQGKKSS